MSRILTIPEAFTAVAQDYIDFEPVLRWFDWTITDEDVTIDFRACRMSNYQSLALLLEYVWTLRRRGCKLDFWHGDSEPSSGYDMWSRMGARGWSQVLNSGTENFVGSDKKPLIAIRNTHDRQYALRALEDYTAGFSISYHEYLSDVVNELLYNTLEHGRRDEKWGQVPSVVQFSWYQNRNELSILVADTGIGVKRHLEQSYPAFETDVEALRKAIQPETSGTFGRQSAYGSRNNAGMGLFVSSELMKQLRADLWIVSGGGQLHVSPLETTTRVLQASWPGTFVLLTLRLRQAPPEIPHGIARSELLEQARRARPDSANGGQTKLTVSVYNYFGRYPSDKEEATKYRDKHLLPAVSEKKQLLLDFDHVETVTHSFLNALLAGPIRAFADQGLNPYKYVRSTNANEKVRETIDFILDTNT